MTTLLTAIKQRENPEKIKLLLLYAEQKEIGEALTALVTPTESEYRKPLPENIKRLDDYCGKVLPLLLARFDQSRVVEYLNIALKYDLQQTYKPFIKHAYTKNEGFATLGKNAWNGVKHALLTALDTHFVAYEAYCAARDATPTVPEQLQTTLAAFEKTCTAEITEITNYFYAKEVMLVHFWGHRELKADPEKFFSFYTAAVEAGALPFAFAVGTCYLTGIGVKRDYAKAIDFFARCAATNPSAVTILSHLQQGQLSQALQVIQNFALKYHKWASRDLTKPEKSSASTETKNQQVESTAAETKETKSDSETLSPDVCNAAGLALLRFNLNQLDKRDEREKAAEDCYQKLSKQGQEQAKIERAVLDVIAEFRKIEYPIVPLELATDIFQRLNIPPEIQQSPVFAKYLSKVSVTDLDVLIYSNIETFGPSLAEEYRNLSNHDSQFFWNLRYALFDNPEGQKDLGITLAQGTFHHDPLQAVHWLRHAASHTEAKALKNADNLRFQLRDLAFLQESNNEFGEQGYTISAQKNNDLALQQCFALQTLYLYYTKCRVKDVCPGILDDLNSETKKIAEEKFFTASTKLLTEEKLTPADIASITIDLEHAAENSKFLDVRLNAALAFSKTHRTKYQDQNIEKAYKQLNKLIATVNNFYFCHAFIQELQALAKLTVGNKQLLAELTKAETLMHLKIATLLANKRSNLEKTQYSLIYHEIILAKRCYEQTLALGANKDASIYLELLFWEKKSLLMLIFQENDQEQNHLSALADLEKFANENRHLSACLALVEYYSNQKAINVHKLLHYQCLALALRMEQKEFSIDEGSNQLQKILVLATQGIFDYTVKATVLETKDTTKSEESKGDAKSSTPEQKQPAPTEKSFKSPAYFECLLPVITHPEFKQIATALVNKEIKSADPAVIMRAPLHLLEQAKLLVAAKQFTTAIKFYQIALELLLTVLKQAIILKKADLQQEVMNELILISRLKPFSNKVKSTPEGVPVELKGPTTPYTTKIGNVVVSVVSTDKFNATPKFSTHSTLRSHFNEGSEEFSALTGMALKAKTLIDERSAMQIYSSSMIFNYKDSWQQFNASTFICYGFQTCNDIIYNRVANNDFRRALLAIMYLIAKFPEAKKDYAAKIQGYFDDIMIKKPAYEPLITAVKNFAQWRCGKTNTQYEKPIEWIMHFLNVQQTQHKQTFKDAYCKERVDCGIKTHEAKREINDIDSQIQRQLHDKTRRRGATSLSLTASGAGASAENKGTPVSHGVSAPSTAGSAVSPASSARLTLSAGSADSPVSYDVASGASSAALPVTGSVAPKAAAASSGKDTGSPPTSLFFKPQPKEFEMQPLGSSSRTAASSAAAPTVIS